MKITIMRGTLATMFPILSVAITLDPTFGSVVLELTNMNNFNLGSGLALDAGAVSISAVAGMQGALTQACNAISGAITDDKASFNGDQCSRINDLFSTSATHAMAMLNKIDSLAKADQLSATDAETLERIFQDQGPACDKSAKALDGACPASAVGNTEDTQGNIDKGMQAAEADLQANAERKRRV